MIKQGLILFPEMTMNRKTGAVNIKTSNISKKNYIMTALYWDNAKVFQNRIIFIGMDWDKDYKLLKDEKILSEETLETSPSFSNSSMEIFNATNKRILELIGKKDFLWVPNEYNETFLIDSGEGDIGGGEILSLVNALPMPSDNTDLHDILKFKSKRLDNLTALRVAINEFEIKILEADDKKLATKKAINEIDKACCDLVRLYKESKIKFNLGNIKFNFSQGAIASAFGGYGVAYTAVKKFEIPETAAMVASLAYGVSSFIDVSASVSLKKIDKTNPFIYAADVETKLV